jgi:small-conductance mechanosensitive channel
MLSRLYFFHSRYGMMMPNPIISYTTANKTPPEKNNNSKDNDIDDLIDKLIKNAGEINQAKKEQEKHIQKLIEKALVKMNRRDD